MAEVTVSYDSQGYVVATKDLKLTPPWVVVSSTSYEGRYFFLNPETHQSLWALPPHLLLNTSTRNPSFSDKGESTGPRFQANSSISALTQSFSSSTATDDTRSSLGSGGGSGRDSILLSTSRQLSGAAAEERELDADVEVVTTGVSASSSFPSMPMSQIFGVEEQSKIRKPPKLNILSNLRLPDINETYNSPTPPTVGGSMDSYIQFGNREPNKTSSLGSAIRERMSRHLWPASPPGASIDTKGSCLTEANDSLPTLDEINEEDATSMFTVIEGLGRGGYSVVVKVQHLITKKTLAMKVIPKNLKDNKAKRENHKAQIRFELRVMTKVSLSPFLQRCYHAFESPSSVFFLLDLNSGGDLFYHLVKRIDSNTRFTEEECQILLAETYLALEHLHKHNIMHRDIKIENIMLDAQGHVKLVDFGLAVEMTAEIQSLSSAGSLLYMAPELVEQKFGGRFTDWWAFGILAHELLTGSTPWSSLTDSKVIKWEIVHKIVLPPSYLSRFATKMISSLACQDYRRRLGTYSDDEIRSCSFFKSIDWEAMSRLELPPAFIPNGINVNKEDQDDALEGYKGVMDDIDKPCPNQWFLGLEGYSKYLL